MTPFEILLAVVICWNVTSLIVTDNVFSGTREAVLGFLDEKVLGSAASTPGRPRRSGLLGVQYVLTKRAQARYLGRRQRLAPLLDMAATNLEDSRAQEAILSIVWWGTVLAVGRTAGTLFFPHHLPGFLALKAVSLVRLLAFKLYEGLHCPFCVSVWTAVPAVLVATRHGITWRDALVYGLVVSGGARLLFHASVLATVTRRTLKAKGAAGGPG